MRCWAGAVLAVVALAVPAVRAQTLGGGAENGPQALTIAQGCVTSRYFDFSYRLPEGMKAQQIPNAPPAAGAPRPVMLFVTYRDRGPHRDVAVATAEELRGEKEPSAAKWMDRLREANAGREGVVNQSSLASETVNGQKFWSLTFQQVREDGSVVNEAVYATALRGYVVSFTFGSAAQPELAAMAQSIQSFEPSATGCGAGK